jgi:hypothetical protein
MAVIYDDQGNPIGSANNAPDFDLAGLLNRTSKQGEPNDTVSNLLKFLNDNPNIEPETPAMEAEAPAPTLAPRALPKLKAQPKPKVEAPKELKPAAVEQAPALDLPKEPESVYGADLDDAALKEALDAQKRQQGLNLMLRGGGEVIRSGGTAVGHNLKADEGIYKALEQAAGTDVSNIETRRKGLDAQTKREDTVIDLNDKKEKINPDSLVSKVWREVAIEYGKKHGINIPDTATAASLEKILPLLKSKVEKKFQQGGITATGTKLVFDPETGEYKDSGVKATDSAFSTVDPRTGESVIRSRRSGAAIGGSSGPEALPSNVAPEEASAQDLYKALPVSHQKKADKLQQDFVKEVKEDRKSIGEINTIRNLLSTPDGKPQNVALIQRAFARLRDSGALNAQDVKDNGGIQSWEAKINQAIQTASKGNFTPENRQFLLDSANSIVKSSQQTIKQKALSYSNALSTKTDLSLGQAQKIIAPEFASGMVRPKQVKSTESTNSDKVQVIAPNGKVKLIPRDQLDAALKAGGRLK